MTTQKSQNKLKKIMRVCGLGAMLLVMLIGTSSAGPVGAEGDIYVIAHYQGDYPFFSPAVLQYDGETGELVGPFATAIYGNFMGMDWGPNGNLYVVLMMSTGNWAIREYDGETGEFLNIVVEYSVGDFNLAKGMTFGPSGDMYVGNFWLGNITRYDGTTFEVKANTHLGGIGTPSGMLFNENGDLLVVSGGNNNVRLFHVEGDGIQEGGVFATTTGSVQAQDMTFGPNGNLFVAMGTAGGVFEYDGWSGEPIGEFVPFDTELRVNGLGFDNFGRLLVSAIYPLSRVDAYDATTGEPMGPFLTDGLGGSDSIPTILRIKPSEGSVGIDDAYLEPDPTDTPQSLVRLSVYPNPFNPRTTISFSIEQPQNVELFIFDMTGKRIAVLANREFQAGTYSMDWQGKDLQGRAVSSGTYLVRMRTEERVTSEKIMLVR